MPRHPAGTLWTLLWLFVFVPTAAWPQNLPGFDFSRADTAADWRAAHDVAPLRASPEGLVIPITGGDPYIVGPPRDYPAEQPLWLRMRLRSDQAGSGQIFFFSDNATEENSVRFLVRPGVWDEIRVPLPPLGNNVRFRFDPPGTGGNVVLASLSVEPRPVLQTPDWPAPDAPDTRDARATLTSGDLRLVHADRQWGGWQLFVAGEPMATGWTRPRIGYLMDGQTRWLDLARAASVTAERDGDALKVRVIARDPDGAEWRITQRFAPASRPGALEVETRLAVSADRSVVFLPVLMVLPGAGSFGARKHQALFAGLEYLDDEPSSSEADITGPAARRQVPDDVKITFPLMVVQAQGRYVALMWERDAALSALFDSPDRIFRGGGHAMGLLFPGSNGQNREEGSLLPYEGTRLAASAPLVVRATILGGRGDSVVPAVQAYVARRGLPPVPQIAGGFSAYASRAAGGWLDSRIREGDLFRHAFWPGFEPQPAADAALMMDWLAGQISDVGRARRLTDTARDAVARVPLSQRNAATVSHVHYPVGALVYGGVAESVEQARQAGHELLGRFEADGSVRYRRAENKPDFGRTHFAPDANGLTAQVVGSLLESAVVSGDADLVRAGLEKLRALDKFAGGVPRGAQTWEVPLHTPDILASAHLVRAYTLGYELTGDAHLLDQARYWAWTGVPFVYLSKPTPGPVGTYATIAVLGATSWVAPVWFGQPVQWCGLVYADALYRFAPHDPGGPWKRLADGITASGIQQSWPASDRERQGLLPDFYHLRAQMSDGPAINPGTVQANAVRLFDRPALYDFRVFRPSGLMVHAPGALTDIRDAPGQIAFTVRGWPKQPYFVLVNGLTGAPQVRINNQDVPLAAPHTFRADAGQLILQVTGQPRIELRVPTSGR